MKYLRVYCTLDVIIYTFCLKPPLSIPYFDLKYQIPLLLKLSGHWGFCWHFPLWALRIQLSCPFISILRNISYVVIHLFCITSGTYNLKKYIFYSHFNGFSERNREKYVSNSSCLIYCKASLYWFPRDTERCPMANFLSTLFMSLHFPSV